MNKQSIAVSKAIDSLVPKLEKAFKEAINDFANSVDYGELVRLIEAGNIDGAVDLFRADASVFSRLRDAVYSAYATGGQLTEPLAPSALVGVFRFDSLQAAAIRWVQDHTGTSIQGITDQTLQAVRQVITEGLADGTSSSILARSIVGTKVGKTRVGGFLGLTTQISDSIVSGRRKLLSGDPRLMKEYLALELRDHRYDKLIKMAIRDGRVLTKAKVEEIIQAHKMKALGHRGKTIAKFESHQALTAGRVEGMRQIMARPDVEGVTKRWQHNLSVEPRQEHVMMDGETIQFEDKFILPDGTVMEWPHDENAPAEHTINCRCMAIFRVQLKKG